MKQPAVYILASRRNGTLYAGVTSDLVGRVAEHKSHAIPGFTQRHRVDLLVWYEAHPTMESAIRREKAIKEWRREWKLQLIERGNPGWRDLYPTLVSDDAAQEHRR
jgi:putative endonuclease